MRLTTTQVALLALPLLVHATPVSLIDFVPRVSDVSSDCNKVYQQKIPDCDSKDFTQQECSTSCVKGLESMTTKVEDACGNEGLLDREGERNVLQVFLTGQGPSNLCTNANEVLQGGSSADTTTTSESSSSTASPPEYSTTSIASSTATASSGDVPTSLVMDTSALSESTSSASSTDSEATASATSADSSQIFDAPSMPSSFPSASATSEPTGSTGQSGGGSPFDAEGNQFSAATATSLSAWMLVLAVAFAGFAAQW